MFNRERSDQTTDINLVSTGLNKYIPIDIPIDNNRQKYECDYLYEELTSLVGAIPDLKAWYIKRFYALGNDKILQLASIAKSDGKNPQRLFTYLLNKEYSLKTKST